MNNKIIFSVVVGAFLLNCPAQAARCCSHSIENKSGKFVNVVKFYGSGVHPMREEYNINKGQKKTFTTDQQDNGKGPSAIFVIKVQSNEAGSNESRGIWQGNQNFVINPDLSVTGQK